MPHRFTGFNPGDNLPLRDLAAAARAHRRLFHVINVTLNIVKGARLEWQERKAESFTISPLHCGSNEVGYRPTHVDGGNSEDDYAGGMNLGRAMTISGAAASPNMGYHSSALVTFVMTLFNARLGWWLPNPGKSEVTRKPEPAGALALINEAFGMTTDDSRWIYLSDGGHFENLGLYEMVLRRCHKIVVIDAGSDPEYQFEDLENAVRKIRSDLDISIEFQDGLPTPKTASGRHIHFAIGAIRYSEVDPNGVDGQILYVKPLLSGDEPVDVRRYAETHLDPGNCFPNQTTADQFFNEAQFESYRELGLHSVLTGFPQDWAGEWRPPDLSLPPEAEGVTPEPSPRAGRVRAMVAAISRAWPALLAVASIPTATAVVSELVNPAARESTPSTVPAPVVPQGEMPSPDVREKEVPAPDVPQRKTPAPDVPEKETPGSELPQKEIPAPEIRKEASPGEALPPTGAAAATALVVIQPAEDGRVDRIMLPIFEEASGCDGKQTCARGLEIDDSVSKGVLRRLANVLASCAPNENSKITVKVKGFASSSELKGDKGDNRWLAEQRAVKVAEKLKPDRSPSKLDARPLVWKTKEQMEYARRYVDQDNEHRYWRARADLNRRAEIIFPAGGIGGCEVEEILDRVFSATWRGEH